MSIEIGRGKLIGQQGPGSLYIDTEGSSYIVAAADKWYDPSGINQNINKQKFKISDKRLERILGVNSFYEVPDYRSSSMEGRKSNTYLKIPISRFPLVEYCSKCYTLSRAQPTFTSKKHSCEFCEKATIHIQFPIIVMCEKGHLQDFPFEYYIHLGKDYKNHRMYIDTRKSPSILNWRLRCSCGESHSLAGVTGRGGDTGSPFVNEMKGAKCQGNKPWTGNKKHDENCECTPVAVLKNSLNVYRPELIQTLSLSKEYKFEGTPTISEIQSQEFKILNGEVEEEESDVLKVRKSFENNNDSIISLVNHIDRLQQLIVQTNFHRVEPADDESSFTNATEIQPEDSMLFSEEVKGKWYPAKKVYGEGIFIEFNSDSLRTWEENEKVVERFKDLQNRTEDFYLSSRFEFASSILVHTISHALIREFSRHSGYPMTSLKEKLYLNMENDRYGLLLYVTDSDKAGTFGGLVRLAEQEKFKEIFSKAINNIDWCSSDPVCFEFGESGQGLEESNGSACHNCCYVPDISCGFRNCFLDRDFVSRSGSEITISNMFDWFSAKDTKNTHQIEIIEKGQFINQEYDSWDEFSIETSSYYKDESWRLADYYDSKIKINEKEFEAKYIWEKEKKIILFSDQEIENEYLGELGEWKIHKEYE